MYRNLKELEEELHWISGQSYINQYVAFTKIKKALAQFNFFLDQSDQFIDFSDQDATYFFKLMTPDFGDENSIYLTIDFEAVDGYFEVDVNIVDEENLDEYIGDDEVEEI